MDVDKLNAEIARALKDLNKAKLPDDVQGRARALVYLVGRFVLLVDALPPQSFTREQLEAIKTGATEVGAGRAYRRGPWALIVEWGVLGQKVRIERVA